MVLRRKLEEHQQKLGEIRDIMNSMKTIAHSEIHRLTALLNNQKTVAENIEEAAADFLGFHHYALENPGNSAEVLLLLGTERGFCGNFNEMLLKQAHEYLGNHTGAVTILLALGYKLHARLEQKNDTVILVEGPSVTEEITPALNRLLLALKQLQAQYGNLNLTVFSHLPDKPHVTVEKLLPPFSQYVNKQSRYSIPPLLNLEPGQFLTDLVDHYLFATLYKILFASLLAENQQRIQHLQEAVNHLDEKMADLKKRCNRLRQEEIIEEIEIILLNMDMAEQLPAL